MIQEHYLVTLNARNKVQVVHTYLIQPSIEFEIHRITGQLNGKQTEQPIILIDKGKVKRTPLQQAELQYNAIVKKYLDKGYKDLKTLTSKKLDEIDSSELSELLGSKTDQTGVPKPMLAVQYEKVANNVFEREWYCSRKIDGVRALIYYKDGEVLVSSRGGGEFNVPTQQIREALHPFFEKHPDVILDGELYRHGLALQYISGLARLKTWSDKCSLLEYWVYDYISNETFEIRQKTLTEWKEEITSEKVVILDHKPISGWLNIKNEHDRYVGEGFEGLVMRSPTKEYGIGKRSSVYMIKVKNYRDMEVPVLRYELGLRGVEDMVFVCKAPNGKEFKAKPWGNLEIKQDYVENFDSTYKNKLVKIKFFYFSDNDNEETGVPLQPSAIAFRDLEDL